MPQCISLSHTHTTHTPIRLLNLPCDGLYSAELFPCSPIFIHSVWVYIFNCFFNLPHFLLYSTYPTFSLFSYQRSFFCNPIQALPQVFCSFYSFLRVHTIQVYFFLLIPKAEMAPNSDLISYPIRLCNAFHLLKTRISSAKENNKQISAHFIDLNLLILSTKLTSYKFV